MIVFSHTFTLTCPGTEIDGINGGATPTFTENVYERRDQKGTYG